MPRTFAVATATGVLALTVASARAQSPAPPRAPVSLSIEDALRAAETASESIVVARADVDRARALVSAARSGYLPQVNGSASYTRTLRSEFEDINFAPPGGEEVELPFGQRNTWRMGVIVQQRLFDGARTRATVDQARAGVRASELGVRATRAQIVLAVAEAYFDAALAERQVEIAEVTLQQTEATLTETQLNFKQDAAPEFDVVRAQVARDNQSTLVIQLGAQRDVALVGLRRAIGLPLDQPIALTTRLEADDVDRVIAAARSAAGLPPSTPRLAIEQARQSVELRQAALRAVRSERWPVIAATSDLGLVNYENQPFNQDWRTNWTVGVSLTVPIFDGLRRRANEHASAAELAAARAQLADVNEVSQVEVVQAGASVTASTATLESSTRTVAQARRAYQIAELRFDQGASTHLELVDARIQLEQALLNQARSARDVRVARLRQELLPGLPLGAAAGL